MPGAEIISDRVLLNNIVLTGAISQIALSMCSEKRLTASRHCSRDIRRSRALRRKAQFTSAMDKAELRNRCERFANVLTASDFDSFR
jgi:hypothetical protein